MIDTSETAAPSAANPAATGELTSARSTVIPLSYRSASRDSTSLFLGEAESRLLHRTASSTVQAQADLAKMFFGIIECVAVVTVLLAAPAATAGVICQERARGTLLDVLATDLSSAELVLGKLALSLSLWGRKTHEVLLAMYFVWFGWLLLLPVWVVVTSHLTGRPLPWGWLVRTHPFMLTLFAHELSPSWSKTPHREQRP